MTETNSKNAGWRRMIPRGVHATLGVVLIAVLAFFLGGRLIGGGPEPVGSGPVHTGHADSETPGPEAWTCSMHPQIQLPKQGKCPLCFMDLIPVESGGGDELDPRQIRMSETAMELARIETSPVLLAFADREVRMVGTIDFDETRVSYITAWVPGRIDKLYVDFTGAVVRSGERMAYMYSPELYAVQEELLQAKKALGALSESESTVLKSTAEATLFAAREKLRLYGFSESRIDDVEASGKSSDHQTIYAPAAGVVLEKHVQEGMYVETGTKIYSIADLSKLWVLLEAYESDLPWLRVGQQLSFTSASFPGETFVASISFIDPVVDPSTRTVRARAEVDNRGLRLKPQMFVSGVVASRVDGEGNVAKRTGSEAGAPLLIPVTAPLITGRRAVVYVDISNADGPLFEGREVDLGPRAGDFYIVKSGLDEGELVVTNGAFKIDSELQIRAKPSMMSPEGGGPPPGHQHGAAGGNAAQIPEHEPSPDGDSHGDASQAVSTRMDESEDVLDALVPVYDAYFRVQMALANDDHPGAVSAARETEDAVGKVDMGAFSHAGHKKWMDLSNSISAQAQKMGRSGDIVAAREAFYHLSIAAIELHDSFGHSGDGDFYLTFCPMARDNAGAFWLQAENIVWNSFFGASMLRCGEIRENFPPVTAGVE